MDSRQLSGNILKGIAFFILAVMCPPAAAIIVLVVCAIKYAAKEFRR